MNKFDLLSKDDVETVVIDEDILQRIFEYFTTEPITPQLLRSKAITYILLDTGIRLNELRQLKVKDIDLINNQINLKYTKTNKNRTVFITDKTNETINDYLELVEPEDYFIININSRNQMSHQGIYKFLDDIKKKLNLPSKVSLSFHKFRHTYATTCLEQGASLEFLRKTLGHSDLSTTQKYLHLSNSKLKAEHNTCTPINIFK
ncbi:site-specific integrase [Mycoplasmatota bacterium WC44]